MSKIYYFKYVCEDLIYILIPKEGMRTISRRTILRLSKGKKLIIDSYVLSDKATFCEGVW